MTYIGVILITSYTQFLNEIKSQYLNDSVAGRGGGGHRISDGKNLPW